MSSRRDAWRFLIVFGMLSLVSIAIGCLVARAAGVPAGAWIRNVIAWAVGGLFAAGLARFGAGWAARVFALAAPAGLAISLLSGGQRGVHRWVDVGPVHLNAAELLLPAAVVAIAALAATHRWSWIVGALLGALLVVQPDGSQATAFGAALIVLIALAPLPGRLKAGGAVLVALAVTAAWLRADPLAPVPEVEGIIGLARAISPVLALLAMVGLAATALSPALLAGRAEGAVKSAAWALSAYFGLSALTPLFGAFPVPLVGMGMSPIIGGWLGAGLLAESALTLNPLHAPFRAS